jgi:protein-S-isoprenylcysteine O-methyltransferase Ste14
MGIFERIADSIFRVATGDSNKRWLYTPFVAMLFGCFVALFFIAAYLVDRRLNLPSISYMPWTLIAGLILAVPASILLVWTWVQFLSAKGTPVPINPPRKLITGGLYAYSRNPMLLSIFLIVFAAGLLTGSLSLTLLFAPLFVLFFYFQVTLVEEREMELKFGRDYLDYKNRVPRFFPRIPGKVNR